LSPPVKHLIRIYVMRPRHLGYRCPRLQRLLDNLLSLRLRSKSFSSSHLHDSSPPRLGECPLLLLYARWPRKDAYFSAHPPTGKDILRKKRAQSEKDYRQERKNRMSLEL